MIEDPQRVGPVPVALQGLHLLESCAFTWIFDGATHLFRRVPRNARVTLGIPAAWTPYSRLELDTTRSSFVVVLDETGTRLLRAWLHVDPCDRCTPEAAMAADAKTHILWWKEQLKVVSRQPRKPHPLRPFGRSLGTEGA
jgi:hypothetical protein